MKPIRLKYSVDGQISNMFNKQVRKSWINFKNLLPEDIEALKKISKPLVRDNEIALSTDKPSTWDAPNTAPIVRALEYLHSTGHYLMPSIEDMMKELKLGLKNVEIKLYPKKRHELLKEKNISHLSVETLCIESGEKGAIYYLLIAKKNEGDKIIKCFPKFNFDIAQEDFDCIAGKYYCKK